ncbi:hypothetical protein XENOCAPTIV_028237 [Xenoophorus captivus]|uniref:Uncharacterized protein n=1 Tax=Xenoophorus captivus TaxID=1517983 RepID=A0ABV0Q767_9TELE
MLTACCRQDSEMVYCGRLSLVADLLQGLFKEAYSLQKGLLEVLDRISLDSSASDEEVSDIVTGVFTCVPSKFPPSLCAPSLPTALAGELNASALRKVPVLLPGVMLKGQAQADVTLHQHICVQLCASVAVLPPVYFPVLLEFVAEFPPSNVENLPVWHHVLLRALSQDVRRRVETEIIGLMQRVLKEWQDGGYKLGQVDKVVRTVLDM